jgi:hypothetical protein
MQKTILFISRCVFISIFGLFTLVFLYWELFTLSQSSHKNNSVIRLTTGDSSKVLISSDADNEKKDSEIKDSVVSDDARPVIIQKYLEKYKSPLVPYSKLIFDLSKTYGFDYYWIVAIAQQESNLCKKIPDGSFNCWGYGINTKGTLKFDSYELALKSYSEYLKREYFDKGLNTPELIMKKYCPSSNGSWAFGVRHFIEEMQSGNF